MGGDRAPCHAEVLRLEAEGVTPAGKMYVLYVVAISTVDLVGAFDAVVVVGIIFASTRVRLLLGPQFHRSMQPRLYFSVRKRA